MMICFNLVFSVHSSINLGLSGESRLLHVNQSRNINSPRANYRHKSFLISQGFSPCSASAEQGFEERYLKV